MVILSQIAIDISSNSEKQVNKSIKEDAKQWLLTKNSEATLKSLCSIANVCYNQYKEVLSHNIDIEFDE